MNELVARWRRKNAELKAGTNALLARHPFGENMRPMMREIFAYIDQMPDELESSLRGEAEEVCDRCGYCWERHENICVHATTPPAQQDDATAPSERGEAAKWHEGEAAHYANTDGITERNMLASFREAERFHRLAATALRQGVTEEMVERATLAEMWRKRAASATSRQRRSVYLECAAEVDTK